MYADYEFYSSVYHGTLLDENGFALYGARATSYLDVLTRGQAAAAGGCGPLSLCCFALADQYCRIDELARACRERSAGGLVASEKVGDHSVSYRAASLALRSAEAGLYTVALTYLAFTGLLYTGVPCVDGGKR
jgi:hypothetical protein